MRVLTVPMFAMCAVVSAFAQQWEMGATVGGSFLNNVSATGATVGFAPGLVGGAYLGQRLGSHFEGQVRYEFFQTDLRLASGGQTATFGGDAHAIHYDVLYRFREDEARTQFYAAVGGGIKLFRGTGMEEAYQPLSQYAYFTKAQTIKPMASVGAGLTHRLSERVALRVEVRDFMSAFPTQVLTPAPGVKFGSFLNDIVPMIGIEYVR